MSSFSLQGFHNLQKRQQPHDLESDYCIIWDKRPPPPLCATLGQSVEMGIHPGFSSKYRGKSPPHHSTLTFLYILFLDSASLVLRQAGAFHRTTTHYTLYNPRLDHVWTTSSAFLHRVVHAECTRAHCKDRSGCAHIATQYSWAPKSVGSSITVRAVLNFLDSSRFSFLSAVVKAAQCTSLVSRMHCRTTSFQICSYLQLSSQECS